MIAVRCAFSKILLTLLFSFVCRPCFINVDPKDRSHRLSLGTYAFLIQNTHDWFTKFIKIYQIKDLVKLIILFKFTIKTRFSYLSLTIGSHRNSGNSHLITWLNLSNSLTNVNLSIHLIIFDSSIILKLESIIDKGKINVLWF